MSKWQRRFGRLERFDRFHRLGRGRALRIWQAYWARRAQRHRAGRTIGLALAIGSIFWIASWGTGWEMFLGTGWSAGDIAVASTPSEIDAERAIAAASPRESAGRAAFLQGDYRSAERDLIAAIAEYESREQLSAAAGCDYLLSRVYDERGQVERGLEAATRGLTRLADLIGPPSALLAQLYAQRAQLRGSSRSLVSAIDDWEKSRKFYERIGDRRGALAVGLDLSAAYEQLGFHARSRQLFRAVLPGGEAHYSSSGFNGFEDGNLDRLGNHEPDAIGLDAVEDPELQIWIWLRLADFSRADGQYATTRSQLERGLEFARDRDMHFSVAIFLERLGAIAGKSGNFATAARHYREAATLAGDATQRLAAELGAIDSDIAGFAADNESVSARDIEVALQAIAPRIVALPAARVTSQLAAKFAERVSDWYGQRQSWAIAPSRLLADLESRLTEAREAGDARTEMQILAALARLHADRGDRDRARTAIDRALVLAVRGNVPDVAALLHARLARLSLDDGEPDAALDNYRSAVADLQRLRQTYANRGRVSRLSFQDTIEPIYRKAIGLLLRDEASTADLHEARNLLETLQLAELENYFRKSCLNSQPVDVSAIDPSAAIVYPVLLPDRLEVLLSLPDGSIQRQTTRQSAADTRAALRQARAVMSPSAGLDEEQQALRQLYSLLLEPFEAALDREDIATLVFVLDLPFRSVSMAALYDGERYAIERYAIALAPSLQLLEATRDRRDRFDVFVGALGSPRSGFGQLPGALREAEDIAELAGSRPRLEDDFTLDRLKNVLRYAPHSTIHLATHGQFGSTPETTFVLTWDGKLDITAFREQLLGRDETRDGPIDLLVLSACQTAAGDARASLGMAGFAVQSGVRATIASLWVVNDDATAQQMVYLYEALAKPGTSKAEALREAQRRTIALGGLYAKPYYWAPFVTIGYWL